MTFMFCKWLFKICALQLHKNSDSKELLHQNQKKKISMKLMDLIVLSK